MCPIRVTMSNFLLLLFILKAVVSSAPQADSDDLLVTLSDGQVRGREFVTGNNITYYGFQGIPFATPPLGNLRFEAPIPPQPWSGVLNASKEGYTCLATMNPFPSIEMSEDCLYINVYTPALKPAEKLPVMFWTYGGAFAGGESVKAVYGPDFLIEEDVIMVSHNYRVGALGFLSTKDEAIRGNAGLKDTALAIKWTHDNIALFGGDPEKITIFGQSAGGQSTGLQQLSKLNTGLFRAAIIQSGSTLTNSSASFDSRSYAFELASKFTDGNYGNDTQKLKEFLQQKTAEEVLNAAGSITGEDMHAWPTVEVEGEGAFLTESPYVLLESGNFNKVPVIIGITAEESLAFINDLASAQELALMLDTDQKKVIPLDLRPDVKDEEAAIAEIKNIYLNENETFSTNLVALAEYTSDNKFARALIKTAELQSNYVPVYLYQFAYYGRTTTVPFIDGLEKATHSAEMPFIFNITLEKSSVSLDESDLLTQNRMVKLWTNFAKYLNPTPEEIDLFGNVTWPTTSATNLQYLNINGTLEVRPALKENVYRNWNETFYKYGEKPFITF